MSLAHGRLVEATAWRFGYLIIQGGGSLLLFAALAHALEPSAFAVAAVAQAVLVLAQAIGDFGLSQAAVSALPYQYARQPANRASLQAGAARAFLWAAGLALALSLVAALIVPGEARWAVAAIGPGAGAAVIVSGADGLLRATGDFRRPLKLVAAARGGGFVAVPVALLTDDALLTCIALSAATVICSLPAARLLHVLQAGQTAKRYRDLVAVSLPLGLAQLFIVVGGRTNTVVLGSYLSLMAAATFESTWRLYQLGLYVAGGLATSISPFIGDALGDADLDAVRTMLVRHATLLAFTGTVLAAILVVMRVPVSELLFDEYGASVARSVIPLAAVLPLGFVGFLALTTLAPLPGTRLVILLSNAFGAMIGVTLVVVLGQDHGVRGAAIGCAIGLAVTNIIMIGRFAVFVHSLAASPVGGHDQVA